MELSDDDMKKLARLARLALGGDELHALRDDLVRIVGFVAELREVDVEGVEPMAHPVPMPLRRRADVAADDVAGRRALEGSAGYTADGLVRLPRIVE